MGKSACITSIWRLIPATNAVTSARVAASIASASIIEIWSIPTVRCAISLAT